MGDTECHNTVGSFECLCKKGFVKSGKDCKDLNECDRNNTCSATENCVNNHGSYDCACKQGKNFTTVIRRNKTPLATDFVRKGVLFPHFSFFQRSLVSGKI